MSKTTEEFDTDEVKAINKYIANAPQYFEQTRLIYGKVFGNGVPGMDEDLRELRKDLQRVLQILQESEPLQTKRNVDTLIKLGWLVFASGVGYVIVELLKQI